MAKMSKNLTRIIVGVVVLAVVVGVGAYFLFGGSDTKKLTARFDSAVGVYDGTPVDILGVEVGQIANSLVFVADGEPLLVLTSGRHRVDTAKVATLVGVVKVGRADADFVREHTGVAIGGVSPVAHPRPLRTLVDIALRDYDVVWAAAGHTHAVFPTTYDELVRVSRGTPSDVAAHQ